MKKLYGTYLAHKAFIVLVLLAFLLATYGQPPQGFNYQGVIRNNQGALVTNNAVGLKFNIRQGSASGVVVYSETHLPTTDQFGSVSLVIGQGTVVSGTFSAINWASGVYYNEVLLDISGGTNYVSMGAAQLMSVPYALYAGSTASSMASNNSGYDIKLNNVSVSDSSLDFVLLGNGNMFMTKENYRFECGLSLFFYTDSSDIKSFYSYTGDTLTQSTVYSDYRGAIFKIPSNTNGGLTAHANQIYYTPLNASPLTINVAAYNISSGVWLWSTRKVYQAFPNNPSVTGFNLQCPFSVQVLRH